MKLSALATFAFALLAAGCTSKSAAQRQARTAFFAGQSQGMERALAAQRPAPAPGNTVAILGPVKTPALTWTPDLTLARTILAAEYTPADGPAQIFVTRQGAQFSISPADLLNGSDIPVLPGDVVELRP